MTLQKWSIWSKMVINDFIRPKKSKQNIKPKFDQIWLYGLKVPPAPSFSFRISFHFKVLLSRWGLTKENPFPLTKKNNPLFSVWFVYIYVEDTLKRKFGKSCQVFKVVKDVTLHWRPLKGIYRLQIRVLDLEIKWKGQGKNWRAELDFEFLENPN